LLYIRSNFALRAPHASAIAVVFDNMHLLPLAWYEAKFGRNNLHSAIDLGQVTIWHKLRRLVADTNLETSWAPVDKLDGTLGLNASNSTVHLLGDNVSTVQQAGSHVLSVAWVALDHLVVGLEARVGDFLDGVGLV
jgi:hypothetical protein